jgi:hypothetical protein
VSDRFDSVQYVSSLGYREHIMGWVRDRMRAILDSAGPMVPAGAQQGAVQPTWRVTSQTDKFYYIIGVAPTEEGKKAFSDKFRGTYTCCVDFAVWVLNQPPLATATETLKRNLHYGRLETFGKANGCWVERDVSGSNLPQCGDIFNPKSQAFHVGFCYECHEETKVLDPSGRLRKVEWTKVEGGQNNGRQWDSVWKCRKPLTLTELVGWFDIEAFLGGVVGPPAAP